MPYESPCAELGDRSGRYSLGLRFSSVSRRPLSPYRTSADHQRGTAFEEISI